MHAEGKSCGVRKVSTQISEEVLGGQAMCPWEDSVWSCVKPEVQWRHQKVGKARNTNDSRKVAKQLKSDIMGATTTSNTIVVEALKPFEVPNLPHFAGDTGSGTVGFNFYCLGFQSCFISVPSYPLSVILGMEISVLYNWMWQVFNFLFIYAEACN